jgi:16S rRNA A1518/A1519 N6-dimethyltransferase RsmA/KsgA/DIM1 with predicted DNA glycosylase/AP lyase activity
MYIHNFFCNTDKQCNHRLVQGDSMTDNIYSEKSEMIIGNTTYIITTHFNKNAQETAEDKMLRLVSNRVSNEINCKNNATN